jgi:hypothetical protein
MSELATATTPQNPAAPSILDSYVKTAPSDQNAVDIFTGEWASKFPPPFEHIVAGGIPLFQDSRFHWAIGALGGVQGQNVLELGPLEGGHAFILERAGVASVISIEANTRAYLKCLIAKEILNLSRTRFLCGDFIKYLETCKQHFDMIVASGVLYHMKDPLHMLELCGTHTDRLYIWSHYYDADIINSKDYLKVRFQHQSKKSMRGAEFTEYRHDYLNSLTTKGFCGGSEEYSVWLSKDGMLSALRSLGFTHFDFSHEMPDHPHGPALSLIAVKK